MTDTLDRANDVLDRTMQLDDAVAQLNVFRTLLDDLNFRAPVKLGKAHVQAVASVRAGLLRSTIGLAVAILDPADRRGNRASLGQIIDLLKDQSVADRLTAPDARRSAKPNRQRLLDACARYEQLYAGTLFHKVRHLRHSIAHLLVDDGPSLPRVDYSDVFWLADQIEECVAILCQGFGVRTPRFLELKAPSTERAKLFWDTYLRGASVSPGEAEC